MTKIFVRVFFLMLPFLAQAPVLFVLGKKNHRICIVRLDYIKNTNSNDIELELSLYDVKSLYKDSLQDSTKDSLTVNFESMMENTNDYIYFKNHNHVFTGASQSLVSLCDPVEHWTDFLGQTDYDLFPEEYADKYFNLERAVFSGQLVAKEIQKTLSTDGKEGWIDNHKYPINDKQGEIIGLFGVARDITEQKLAENYAFHQGNYDSLTDLPSRALFFDRLSLEVSKARRSNNSIGLLFLDLDGFKEVNDRFGHDAGDQVLVSVTQRWLACLRNTDTLARIGGDEFAIIISDIQDANIAGSISRKMINALSSTISILSNQECQVGVSIGISIYP
ncbi:MAG: GGDEF domain-containing protein, partial [Mariprofundaceae bacterium]|nr:GGDEF domain-containing protein [Mariprofundaceae bacterium]